MDLTPLAARSLAGLLEQMTGQQLSTNRRWRFETALQPIMREHDIASLDMLAAMASQPSFLDLREAVVEALLNHETSFFRDLPVYKSIGSEVLPTMARARAATRRLRIWSAGCSTGQEPHSLAMTVAAQDKAWDGWSVDILGTDISPKAIAQARDGLYSQFEVQRGLPITELLNRFDQEGESWRIRPSKRARVQFAVHNLLDTAPAGHFDIVLCRNVLLYFAADRRRQVLDRLAAAMPADGMLILGAGETVLGQTDAFTPDPALRGIYRRVM